MSLYGTTMAQMWKSEVGADKAAFAPATQYLGIDATKVGMDNLSLHLFGWGRTDLKESTALDGSKSGGYLNFGYMQYQFDRANAEVKAGRFTVVQSTGFEQVDGVSARTDLVNGFTISAFAGRPVLYRTVDAASQKDYTFQNDFIFGGRIGVRVPGMDFGVSYLQDGTTEPQNLAKPSNVDYTRKQLGMDIRIAPASMFDVRGRTVLDVAHHVGQPADGQERNNVAEHDYTATMKFGSDLSVSYQYAERNFYAYYAGTNLPSLFRQDDKDMFQSRGLSLTWNAPWSIQAVADFKHTNRLKYGEVNRVGGELRWANGEKNIQAGLGGHYVNAEKTLLVDAVMPSRSLSHTEGRAWVMVEKGKLSASLDGIVEKFKSDNPYLAGMKTLYEFVGSVGYQATANLKVSGDLTNGSTPAAKSETRGLLRAEYRFGMAKKGGK